MKTGNETDWQTYRPLDDVVKQRRKEAQIKANKRLRKATTHSTASYAMAWAKSVLNNEANQ